MLPSFGHRAIHLEVKSMRSKQFTQEQEEYLCFDKHRQVANRIILILFVALLVCVAVSWHLANITYVPASIVTGVFLAKTKNRL